MREKGDRGEGPRTAETWYVSRHDDPRTEVLGGAHPKFKGGGVPKQFFLTTVTWFIWFGYLVHLVE